VLPVARHLVERIGALRAAWWHLRRGGLTQLRRFRERHRAESAEAPRGRVRSRRAPALPGLRVGVVLDDVARVALGYEWDGVVPSVRSAGGRPSLDLLVVGSAPDGAARAWREQLRAEPVPGSALGDLIRACRDASTPTVLWDTEHRDAPLLTAARLFDRVYAADAQRSDRYRGFLAHDRIGLLPPAVQPVLDNPGARRHGLRNHAVHEPAVLNREVDGTPADVRAVLERAARGTVVITAPGAAGAGPLRPGEVLTARDADEAALVLRGALRSPQLRDRATHRAQRRIWREHTYGARVRRVLADVGLPAEGTAPPRPEVTAVVATTRPAQVDHVLRTVASQRDVQVQLALLAHGFDLEEREVRRRCHDLGIGDVVLLAADRAVPLGTCLNRLAASADAPVVAKLDDDDLYGSHYLADQLHALAYAGADVVGKQAHHVHLRASDATVLRFGDREHRWTDRVAGPTLVCARDVVVAARFPEVVRGEDTGLLRRVLADGARVYSADRFNFVHVRSGQDGAHTWRISDEEVLATGELLFYGAPEAHVFV
jgi:hypothetical protein